MPRLAVLCCAVLCCAVLCCAVLCCAVLGLCCVGAGLGWAGLGWAGLGWAGLGWAGLGCAVPGWTMYNNGCCDIICTNLTCNGHHYIGAQLPLCGFAVTVTTLQIVILVWLAQQ